MAESESPDISQKLRILFRMPGLNDMVGKNAQAYGRKKKELAEKIGWFAKLHDFRPVLRGHFSYHFTEQNAKRDPINFCAGAVKLIEDALQECGLLAGDGQANVLSYAFSWEVGERSMVDLLVTGPIWEESQVIRESKGQSKFRRGNRSSKGLQKVAGSAGERGKPKARARLPVGHKSRGTRGAANVFAKRR